MKNYYIPLIVCLFFACKQKISNKFSAKDPDFIKGELLYHKFNDSAFYYLSKAANNSNDSSTIAESLNYMATIQSDAGDYFGAQESVMQSLKFLKDESKKTDSQCRASNYNELGFTYNNLHNYIAAIPYFKKALQFTNDSLFRSIIKNNMALSYQKLAQYDQAIKLYQSINATKDKNKKEYARILSNMTKTKWLKNPSYNAAPQLLTALKIRTEEKDEMGINASFSHLSDYYTLKFPDSALIYALKRYEIAKKINSPDDELEALQKLINLSPKEETKIYFATYQRLNDSVQIARNAAKNQFAVIRYDSEKNRADFLKAQAENEEKQNDIILKNIGLGILILFLILGFILYRRRQKALKNEKELEVKKTELKYVKKIHDEVANKIYQVMTEVENDPEMDKTEVADKLEIVYKISRDLSYKKNDTNIKESFFKDINKMLYAYSSDKVEIVVKGSDEKLWANVEENTKNEVYLILQNLMTNMAKHSGADYVSIEFIQKDGKISILYFDNGKGMHGAIKKNGLTNTENRIENISGSITFDTKPDAGLEIKLSFPI